MPEPGSAGLSEMFKDTLRLPFRAGALLDDAARKPAPGYLPMACNVAVFTAAMFALNLAYFTLTFPDLFPQATTWLYFTLLGLGVALAASFLLAGLVHALGRLSGGGAPFARSYQIVSLLSLIGPLQALSAWISGAWLAPGLLGACLTIMALERLHKSAPAKTRALVCCATLFALAGAHVLATRLEKYAALVQALKALAPAPREAQNPGPDAPTPQFQAAPPPAQSGLDFVVGPKLEGQPQAPAAAGAAAPIPQAGVEMFDSAMPLLNNPALTRDMNPQQAKQIEKLRAMMRQMQNDIRRPMTAQQRAQSFMEFQRLAGELLKNFPAGPPAAEPGKK